MNYQILDLYSDYLLSSFGQTTATGLSKLVDGAISHDQVTRMLASEKLTSKTWWQLVKAQVRQMEREDGVMIIDDSIVDRKIVDFNPSLAQSVDRQSIVIHRFQIFNASELSGTVWAKMARAIATSDVNPRMTICSSRAFAPGR